MVADMVNDMEVDMVANKVADMLADIAADMAANMAADQKMMIIIIGWHGVGHLLSCIFVKICIYFFF